MWLWRHICPFHNKDTSVPKLEVPTVKNFAKGKRKQKRAHRNVPAVPALLYTSLENMDFRAAQIWSSNSEVCNG